MHWDGGVSIGNILTVVAMVTAMFMAGNRFVSRQGEGMMKLTDALNNLAGITEKLQKAVENQDSRLTSLETEHKIQVEVARRMVTATAKS